MAFKKLIATLLVSLPLFSGAASAATITGVSTSSTPGMTVIPALGAGDSQLSSTFIWNRLPGAPFTETSGSVDFTTTDPGLGIYLQVENISFASQVEGVVLQDVSTPGSPVSIPLTPGLNETCFASTTPVACTDVRTMTDGFTTPLAPLLPAGDYRLSFFESGNVFTLGDVTFLVSSPAAVPVPATGLMLIAGIGAIGAWRLRRKAA